MGCGCTHIGKGIVRIARYDTPNKLLPLSNTSTFTVNREGEQITIPDEDSVAGGNCAVIDRISRITLGVSSRSYCPETLEVMMAGEATETAAGAAVTGETARAFRGGFIPFERLPDWTAAYTVGPVGVGADWIEDTDFIRSETGIEIPMSSNIVDDTDVVLGYQPLKSNTLEAFLFASRNYRVYLDGINLTTEKPFRVDAYKVAIGGADASPWKGNDVQLAFTGEVQADSSKTGAGVSKYMKADLA